MPATDPRLRNFDTSDRNAKRHQTDADLRARGFKIHARPRGSDPIWIRDGILYAQCEAVRIMRKESKATNFQVVDET